MTPWYSIRKTPNLLFVTFSYFFILFSKKAENVQKSQVLYFFYPFSRGSKKLIIFKKYSNFKKYKKVLIVGVKIKIHDAVTPA